VEEAPPTDQPSTGRPDSRSAAVAAARHLRLDLGPLRRSRELKLLFVGSGVSFAGSMMTYVALPFQAYALTHSSLIVGLLSLAELIALLVTALLGGALADAVDRRRLLLITEGATCAVTALLVVNTAFGSPRLWVLFTVAFLLAGLEGLQRPSMDSLIPRLVAPEDLAATSAVMSLRTQFGMIAAPAAAGILIASVGLTVTYGIDLGTFAVSLVALALLRVAPPPAQDSEFSRRAIGEGLRYAWARKDLLGSYLVDMNAMFFGIPLALFPQVATHLGGPSALGVLYAAPAVGSFLVTATSGWTRRVTHLGRLVATGAVAWGVGVTFFGLVSSLWLAALMLVIAGAGDMVSGIGRSTMWNQSIPDALRGRLAGIEMLSYSSGPTLGNVESGLVESFAGLRPAIVSGGLACIAGSALLSFALPTFWNYRSEDGAKLRATT
jgi:MFS family permease